VDRLVLAAAAFGLGTCRVAVFDHAFQNVTTLPMRNSFWGPKR
jgi:nitroreductase